MAKHNSSKPKKPNSPPPSTSDKRYSIAPQLLDHESYAQETNILELEGFLFDLRRKHAKSSSKDAKYRQTFTAQNGHEITVAWHPDHGRPTVTAYNVLQALFVKSTSEKYPFERAVAFHQNDILRLTGKARSGASHELLYKALKQLQNTTITFEFYNKDLKRHVRADIKVIGSMFTVRDNANHHRIEKALVYWDPLIVDSMNADYWAAFNWSRMKDLDPVQSILFKRIFHHFASRAGGQIGALPENQLRTAQLVKACLNNPIQKDLLDIFSFWLGGLKLPKHKSDIIRQFGPRMDGLKKTGLIKSWKVEKQKTQPGFKLVASPGTSFSDDYLSFYHSKLQPELKFKKAQDDAAIKNPIELLVIFHEARSASSTANVDTFTSKEMALATALIERHTQTGAREFIAYGVARAQSDKFPVRYLMGISQYEADWLASREATKASKAKRLSDEQQQIEDELLVAYRRFSEAECDAWFFAQDDREQQRLNELALQSVQKNLAPKIRASFQQIERRKIVRKMIPVPSYADWKKHRD